MPGDAKHFLYATEDFELNDEAGENAKTIVVPEGVNNRVKLDITGSTFSKVLVV
jgi:hypothetical protein